MNISRRNFFRFSGAGLLGMLSMPWFLQKQREGVVTEPLEKQISVNTPTIKYGQNLSNTSRLNGVNDRDLARIVMKEFHSNFEHIKSIGNRV